MSTDILICWVSSGQTLCVFSCGSALLLSYFQRCASSSSLRLTVKQVPGVGGRATAPVMYKITFFFVFQEQPQLCFGSSKLFTR